jgi:hypothetical protein
MMNFNELCDKITDKGFRKSTVGRPFFDEEGNELKVYDFEHRKKLDMFSVYLDEFGAVKYVEFTKVEFDQATKKFSQNVHRYENDKYLKKFLG